MLNSAGVEVDTPPYTYLQLLERAVGLLHQHNPEYSEKRRHTMKPPQLVRREFSHSAVCIFHYIHFTFHHRGHKENLVDQFPRNLQDDATITRPCFPVYDG